MLAPAALMTAKPRRRALHQAELPELDEGLAKRADVAQVAARHHDPVRHLPAQGFQHPEHDCLLPFEPEGVDAVDQVDAETFGDLLDAEHGIVKVAGDLDGERAMIEGLGELAVGDFTAADENDGPHQPGGGAKDGQRRAGVAGRGAGSAAGADRPRMREGRRHSVVFEAARGIHPFVLEEEAARIAQPTYLPTALAFCKMVCPSPMVRTFFARREGEQLAEHARRR